MKKVFTLLIALAFGLGLKAQCPLTQAVDFTATDCHGTQVHLFDILDSGQAVLIDFFFTTCGPCQQATPKVVESYSTMGCNMHDVFYMEISPSDADPACQNWANNYGVEYPTIGTSGGGSTICNTYQIGAYPTLILIMPNRQIVIQDLWPISNAQTVVTALGQHGLQPHDCNAPSYDPKVSIDIDEVTESSITATFTPNEDCASYYYVCGSEAEFTEWVSLQGNDLPAVMEEHGVVGNTTLTLNFNDLLPETEYAVVALPVDPDGNYGEPAYELVSTPSMPVVYDETLTFSMDTVNLEWCEVTWITVYNNTAEEAVITSICDDLHELGFYIGEEPLLSCNSIEYTIPQGGSVELGIECCVTGKSIVPDLVTITSNLPETQFVVMVDDAWSVNENEASTTLYPNPANDFVTLKGEDLGTVRVYNALGQKVEEFEVNGGEININTAGYESGVYVVKAGEKALRFVVRH
jgi:thiol-disulfide isomerase/thioredoxin